MMIAPSATRHRAAVGCALSILSLCALFIPAASIRASDSLYHDLGEEAGIHNIVEASFSHVLTDDRIKAQFDDSNMPMVKRHLAEFVCQLSGGPCHYTGHDMKAAHRGLHEDMADFNALVEDLQDGMNDAGVPFGVQNRLLSLLAPMSRDIVSR